MLTNTQHFPNILELFLQIPDAQMICIKIVLRKCIWERCEQQSSSFTHRSWVIWVHADKQANACTHEEVNYADQCQYLHMRVNQIGSIIIIQKMKKSHIQENNRIVNSKPLRIGGGESIMEDHKQLSKINKNGQFTGNSLDRIQREYYPQSQRSSQASCSIVVNKNQKKFQHEEDQTKASKDKSNNSSSFSTKAELENEIERLNTQLDIKDEKIKNINKHQQSRKSEIIELHKTINFHKGRIDLMEAQLRSYEDSLKEIAHQCDEKSKYKSQVEELVNLFQGMRKQNQILNGKYQQKSYQLNKLTEKYIKLKQRLNRSNMQKTQQSRSNSSKNQKLFRSSNSLSKRVYEPNISEKVRKNYIWTLQAKIQSIQANMQEISRQNQRLNEELEVKQQIIIELTNKLQQNSTRDSKIVQNALKHQKLQKKTVVHKKQGQIKKLKHSKQNLNKDDKNKTTSSISLILRKLRYHLIGEQLKYQNLLQILVNQQINASTFTQLPYGLNEQQSIQLSDWINKAKYRMSSAPQQEQKQKLLNYLRDRISQYKNLSLRMQHSMKIQIFKQYLNRQNQMVDQVKQSNIMTYFSAQEYFMGWGLRQQQIDIIFKCYYEQTGQIEWINLQILSGIIQRWKNI